MAVDMERAETLVEDFRQRDGRVMELLLDVQDEFNYVPEAVLEMISERLEVPLLSRSWARRQLACATRRISFGSPDRSDP